MTPRPVTAGTSSADSKSGGASHTDGIAFIEAGQRVLEHIALGGCPDVDAGELAWHVHRLNERALEWLEQAA
jgi:hypothetical protein